MKSLHAATLKLYTYLMGDNRPHYKDIYIIKYTKTSIGSKGGFFHRNLLNLIFGNNILKLFNQRYRTFQKGILFYQFSCVALRQQNTIKKVIFEMIYWFRSHGFTGFVIKATRAYLNLVFQGWMCLICSPSHSI